MTTEKKQNENQSSPQNQEAAQTESVTLTPEEKKQELLSVLLEKGKQSKNQLTYTMIADVLENTDLDKNQMEHVFFAVYDDDDNNGEFESLKRKFYQQLKGKFPEFQKEQTFDMKIIKGPSIEELISKAYIGLGSASFIRVDEGSFFPSMFLLIRENDDILYKLRFLQKIQYPLDQKRVYRMLDGKFFMDVFGRSDLRINDAVYHFCVLSIDSRANLWKWITLTKEHEYIDQCYMDALSGNGFRR